MRSAASEPNGWGMPPGPRKIPPWSTSWPSTGFSLELCPISNLRTSVVPSIDAHPVRRYFERGLLVTINTDDPEMFGNSLAQEFQALVDVHGFSGDEIRTLILNAVMASWLSAERRRHLAADLQDDPDWP